MFCLSAWIPLGRNLLLIYIIRHADLGKNQNCEWECGKLANLTFRVEVNRCNFRVSSVTRNSHARALDSAISSDSPTIGFQCAHILLCSFWPDACVWLMLWVCKRLGGSQGWAAVWEELMLVSSHREVSNVCFPDVWSINICSGEGWAAL